MSKSLTALCASMFLSGILTAAAAAGTVPLAGGTAVPVHLASELSSSTAKPGQTFRIVAAAPVVVNGWVAIKKGATGQGTVRAATPAGKSGRQGTLSVAFDWIYGADGSKVPLAAIQRNQSGKNKTGSSNAANVGATLLLGPVGLFAHNFVKGHDINVAPAQVFKAYVGRSVSLSATEKYNSH